MIVANEHISLRIPVMDDLHPLLKWENDPVNWLISETSEAYTIATMSAFIQSNHCLKTHGQLRLMLVMNQIQKPIGTIDFFDFQPDENQVSVGILIGEVNYRKMGLATTGLKLAMQYAASVGIKKLKASMFDTNVASKRLFTKLGFIDKGINKLREYEDQSLIELLMEYNFEK